MSKNLLQKKPGIIVAITVMGVIVANVMLNFQWFKTQNVRAYNLGADEQFANDASTQLIAGTVQTNSDIATDTNGNSVIVWESNNQAPDSDGTGIFFRRFDNKGNVLATNSSTNDQIVNTTHAGSQTDPAITMDMNGNFIVAWSGNGSGDTDGVFIQAFNSSGIPVGSETRVNTTTTDDQRNPSVAIGHMSDPANSIFTVAWESCSTSCEIDTQSYTIDFLNPPATPLRTETRIDNSITSTDATNPSVAAASNEDFVIVWDGTTTDYPTDRQIFGDVSIGGVLNGNIKINGASSPATNPSIALSKNSATIGATATIIITYQGTSLEDTDGGIFAKIMAPGNFTAGPTGITELTVNSTTTGLQANPDVSSDQMSNFTVTWEDDTEDSDGNDIFAQNYKSITADSGTVGGRIGQQFRVNPDDSGDPGNQRNPAIAMTLDGFYTVSYSNLFPTNTDVKFQPFISEMFRSGNELLQNPTDVTAIAQTEVDVAMSPNELFVTVWVDPDDQSLKFTLRDSDNDNAVVGIAGTVIDDTTGPISHPSVSFYTDTDSTSSGYNRFVVAWQGNNGTDQDIYYREVDGTGTPVGTATVINTITTGNQVSPDIAAANYGDATTRRFAITWLEDSAIDSTNESVYSSYLEGSTFSESLLTSGCTQCLNTRVAIDNTSNKIIYVWDDQPTAPDVLPDILFQRAIGSSLQGTSATVTSGDPTNNIAHQNPDIAFLGDDRSPGNYDFIISYDNQSAIGNNEITYSIFAFDNPLEAISSETVSDGSNNSNGKIAAKQQGTGGSIAIMFVWNNFPTNPDDDNVYGQIMQYGSIEAVYRGIPVNEHMFRINATQDGNQFAPSVSMNSSGKIVVGWEGDWQSAPNQAATTTDTQGAITQLLNNPLYLGQTPPLRPEAHQQINQGTRTLSVPDTISFSSTPVNPSTSTVKTVSVRDVDNGGSNLKYFEVEDLFGTPFNITIIADSDFVNNADSQNYIMRSDFEVRNWDQSTTGVDDATNCTNDSRSCFLTIEPTTPPITPTFYIDNATSDFQLLNTDQTLATKTGTDIGKWRWYPEFKLTIPARTPPGNHTASITVTLN